MSRVARAVAHSNIALAKYWGKADVERNLPAVPSLSLTLDALSTTTSVEFDAALESDEARLDDQPVAGRPLARIIQLLDRVRTRAGLETRARVVSHNDFPTAAGLASSASGFAALALAATKAAGLDATPDEVSALGRASSASAARSVYGGFASLGAGAESAERIAPPDHFPVAMLVAVTATGPKSIGSTEGMQHTAATSPYYAAWVEHAPRLYDEVRAAVLARDLEALGAAAEQSALMMHASMLAARPAVLYFSPVTLSVMERVRALRQSGTPAFYTMDAGPHVKVLTAPADATSVAAALFDVPGVGRVIRCAPGPDAHLVEGDAE
jgi:diphosphomevalonate decarboxylase